MPRDLNTVIDDLEREQVYLTTRLNEWTIPFMTDPYRELRRGEVFQQAAELHVIRGVLPFLRGEVNPDFAGDRLSAAADEMRRDILRAVTSTGCSTNPAGNFAERCEIAAKAKMLETLGFHP